MTAAEVPKGWPPPRNFTRPEVDAIREGMAMGLTPRQVANWLGRSERSVRARMKRHGIVVRPMGQEAGQ